MGDCSWQGEEWEEKWGEKYEPTGEANKWADKWAKKGPEIWHEKWGEDYDGRGGCLKYTDKVSMMALERRHVTMRSQSDKANCVKMHPLILTNQEDATCPPKMRS